MDFKVKGRVFILSVMVKNKRRKEKVQKQIEEKRAKKAKAHSWI